jgi:hypothetical protein
MHGYYMPSLTDLDGPQRRWQGRRQRIRISRSREKRSHSHVRFTTRAWKNISHREHLVSCVSIDIRIKRVEVSSLLLDMALKHPASSVRKDGWNERYASSVPFLQRGAKAHIRG